VEPRCRSGSQTSTWNLARSIKCSLFVTRTVHSSRNNNKQALYDSHTRVLGALLKFAHLKTGKRVVALPSLSGLALRARAGRPWPERRGRARAGGLLRMVVLQTSSQLLAKVHGSCACLAKSGSAVSLRCRF
jgi:hypothetical protein